MLRDERVILDRDQAEMYGVKTRVLKQAVRRNIDGFPRDFMFKLTKSDLENSRCQFGTSKGEIKGLSYKPLAFCLCNVSGGTGRPHDFQVSGSDFLSAANKYLLVSKLVYRRIEHLTKGDIIHYSSFDSWLL